MAGAAEPPCLSRVVLTGATGYLGVHLARLLIDRSIEVVAPVRASANPTRLLDRAPSAQLVRIETADALTTVVARARPDVVLHLASPPASAPAEVILAAMDSLTAALTAAMEASPGLAVVAAGTWWEWDEAGNVAPATAYAAAKVRQREALAAAARATGGRVATVIPYDVYGPDDWRAKLLPELIAKAASGVRIAMTSGRQHLDWVHVADVAAAFLRAAEVAMAMPAGEVALYTAGTGVTRDLHGLADLMRQAGGRPLIDWGAVPDRPGQRLRPFYPAPAVPGWRPEVALEAFLREQFARREGRAT